jgi:hypothetical protein
MARLFTIAFFSVLLRPISLEADQRRGVYPRVTMDPAFAGLDYQHILVQVQERAKPKQKLDR